ncbi:hypothetical protein, partial [Endozoicomonas sp. SESOKO2]|uniref:hypothetical protein n=1 Tax=Endozoicomonas sp. SESOKO2 TaxID=2828743 RepID=UPI002147A659
IQEAVQNSFREFPSNRLSREQLARQLSFILLEMQERFLRGKALRSLSHKVDRQKQNPEIARDPAFSIYLSMMTKAFNNHPTLWHTDGKRRHYQEDLSALFMKAADREDYGNEWYQQIRRILDGEKPVPVTSPPPVQIPVMHYSPDESKEESWFQFILYRAMLGMGASLGVISAGVFCMVISQYETEPARQMRLQREKLQRKLGNALNRPGRNDPQGRDWKPTKWDREQIKRATEGFDEKVIKNVLMQAGVLNPLTCNMDLADIYMQISLTELYSHLRQERYIWTAEDERRRRRQQEEEEEERYWAETETTHQQGGVGGGIRRLHLQFFKQRWRQWFYQLWYLDYRRCSESECRLVLKLFICLIPRLWARQCSHLPAGHFRT